MNLWSRLRPLPSWWRAWSQLKIISRRYSKKLLSVNSDLNGQNFEAVLRILFGWNTHKRLVREENIWLFALGRITKLKNTFGDQREQSLVIQYGSEIGTSLDFEWSRRGWFESGLDLNSIWDLASQSFEIQKNSCHFGKNHLKSGPKCLDFEESGFQMFRTGMFSSCLRLILNLGSLHISPGP